MVGRRFVPTNKKKNENAGRQKKMFPYCDMGGGLWKNPLVFFFIFVVSYPTLFILPFNLIDPVL